MHVDAAVDGDGDKIEAYRGDGGPRRGGPQLGAGPRVIDRPGEVRQALCEDLTGADAIEVADLGQVRRLDHEPVEIDDLRAGEGALGIDVVADEDVRVVEEAVGDAREGGHRKALLLLVRDIDATLV